MFFESLCELRDRYAALPLEDRTAVMSIDEAIAWAEAELVETTLELVDAMRAEPPNA
jgi:hypothetical protein